MSRSDLVDWSRKLFILMLIGLAVLATGKLMGTLQGGVTK